MEDKDIIFGSVAWQKRFNRGKWNRYCARECTHVDKPTSFNHQAAFKKFCKRQGIGTALKPYTNDGSTGLYQDYIKVEHHYIESNEPEVDNKTFRLKPLTQPETETLAA